MKRLLHEPLVQFLLIGIVLFGGYSFLTREAERDSAPNQIRLTLDDLAQLEMLFESQWRRPPTAEEFQMLVEDRVREDILYREALAMGLDKDDTIVRRRMAQKMQFLAEDMAAAREPTDAELKAWFEEHPDRFVLPARIAFRHVYFSPDARGAQAEADAEQAREALAAERGDSALATELADPFMFRDYYADATPGEIAREFGPDFADALKEIAPGAWQGPVKSGYGWHVVFVDSSAPARVPAFEEVAPEVKTAWLGDEKSRAWREAYAEMRAKYTVLLPVSAEDLEEPVAGPEAPVDGTDRATSS